MAQRCGKVVVGTVHHTREPKRKEIEPRYVAASNQVPTTIFRGTRLDLEDLCSTQRIYLRDLSTS